MGASAFDKVRDIALGFPEVNERSSHGARCFFVRDKVALCYFHDDHRGDGRVSLWCPAPPGVQQEMVASEPDRFFAPPTSSGGAFKQWLGMFLDAPDGDVVDWDEVAALLAEAYRTVAPKSLTAQLDPQREHRRATTKGVALLSFDFTALLWRHAGDAAWHFVTLPVDVADEIEERTPDRRGFGSIRVAVTIGSSTWSTSIFPDRDAQSFVLPVKKKVRTDERLRAGDSVPVSITLANSQDPASG